MATQIGNDHVSARSAAYLTLCHARLGHYSKGIEWGRITESKDANRKTGAIAYSLLHGAVCYAMLGRPLEAEELLMRLDDTAKQATDPRDRQNAFLNSADGYAALGKHQEALAKARQAFGGHLEELQSPLSVGAYTRWLAAVAVASKKTSAALALIEDLASNRSSYDRIDRTEVLCAKVWLDNRVGRRNQAEMKALNSELLELPQAISTFLRRSGFLES
jgi:tetratricopeptide (TPR) repeat protein